MFQKEAINRILVIRMNRIGDMICAIPLIKTLRSEFPNSDITVFAEEGNAEVIRDQPFINRVIVYRRPRGFFKSRIVNILKALNGARFDLAISVKGGFSSFLAWTAYLSGAAYRIGYVSREKRLLDRLYNIPVERVDFGSLHQVDACLNLLKPLNVSNEIRDISLTIPQSYKDKAELFLRSKGFNPKSGLVIFNISNNRLESCWSGDKIIDLARYFAYKRSLKTIIASIPGDEERAHVICSEIGDSSLYYRTDTIMDFAALCSMCNLLVTGDGGASHIGAASGVTVITLFGAASPFVWSPYGNCHVSLKSEDGNVNSIEVEAVIKAFESKGLNLL